MSNKSRVLGLSFRNTFQVHKYNNVSLRIINRETGVIAFPEGIVQKTLTRLAFLKYKLISFGPVLRFGELRRIKFNKTKRRKLLLKIGLLVR